mmetsp:Transcript_6238/g.16902  ORF Transcript_6238/g.16902 Transcript_6238/m.16902 type:complete len:308 (+) Transcript_6238:74-997(+)
MHAPVWRSTGAAHPVADYDTRYPFSSRRAWPKFGGREKDEGGRGRTGRGGEGSGSHGKKSGRPAACHRRSSRADRHPRASSFVGLGCSCRRSLGLLLGVGLGLGIGLLGIVGLGLLTATAAATAAAEAEDAHRRTQHEEGDLQQHIHDGAHVRGEQKEVHGARADRALQRWHEGLQLRHGHRRSLVGLRPGDGHVLQDLGLHLQRHHLGFVHALRHLGRQGLHRNGHLLVDHGLELLHLGRLLELGEGRIHAGLLVRSAAGLLQHAVRVVDQVRGDQRLALGARQHGGAGCRQQSAHRRHGLCVSGC